MINEWDLSILLSNYKIDSNKVLKTNHKITDYGDFTKIKEVLDYLIHDLKIDPHNIEKSPSVLYRNVDAVKENYEFLKEKDLSKNDINSCLHILNTDPVQLHKTYQYITEKYGVSVLNDQTTILNIPVERIQKMEEILKGKTQKIIFSASIARQDINEIKNIVEVFQKYHLEVVPSAFKRTAEEVEQMIKLCESYHIEIPASIFKRTPSEIESIISICKENKVELKGSVFLKTPEELRKIIAVTKEYDIPASGTLLQRTAEEIEKIVKICTLNQIDMPNSIFQKEPNEIENIIRVCHQNNIKISGNTFLKSSSEIEKIVEICKENKIPVFATVFQRSASEVNEIIKICNQNKIEVIGSIFTKPSSLLKETITYVKNTFGSSYLTPLILSKNKKNLEIILPYLQELGVLPVVIKSPSILTLTKEEIVERKNYLDTMKENMVTEDKFHSIFGLSRKNYQMKKENKASIRTK